MNLPKEHEDALKEIERWAANNLTEKGFIELVDALDQVRGVVEDDDGDAEE